MRSETHESLAKAALLNHLRGMGSLRRAVVISELAVEKWARRADIVTVNGEIVAYEIKTAADRLVRLADQIAAYSAICDKVYAVLATRHMNSAISILPSHVGLKEIVAFRGFLEVVDVREATSSPNLSLISTLKLLPAKEIARLLRAETGRASGGARAELECEALKLPLPTVRMHLRRTLRDKYRASTKLLKRGSARRQIVASDLRSLSVWAKPSIPVASGTPERSIDEWLTDLATRKAFGEVPEDIRALIRR